MKIGLIGNMNNNNFSLMRYFRDLGADAHLLLYKDDGEGSLSHFRPECDTWNIDAWRPFIHSTPIPNASIAALDWPLAQMMSLWSHAGVGLGRQDKFVAPVSASDIRRAYAGYDRLVGSGPTPAVLTRVNMALDVFYPYSIGVEYLQTSEFTEHFSQGGLFKKAVYRSIARRQTKGIQSAGLVFSFDGVTHGVLRDIGVASRMRPMPMVYNREVAPDLPPGTVLTAAIDAIGRSDLSILHHARLMWSEGQAPQPDSKNNHWLLVALARLVARRPDLRPLVLIVEYGPDTGRTRRLAAELGVDRYVHWLPKMARRELSVLVSHVSVVCGEFYQLPRMGWGGTGWEALAGGKPLLQGFNFKAGEYETLFGQPPPPMLPVTTIEDIEAHLSDMVDQPRARMAMGEEALAWFDRYNGIGLARSWLEALRAPDQDEQAARHAE